MLNEIAWALSSQQIQPLQVDAAKGQIEFLLPAETFPAWNAFLTRMQRVFGDNLQYQFSPVEEGARIHLAFTSASIAKALAQAVLAQEYRPYPVRVGAIYDLKLGISCNNNCLHCVIKPRVLEMKRKHPDQVILDSGIGMQCSLDLTYEEVIATLQKEATNAGTIVLTGGEPTLRRDLIAIVRWIYYNRPDVTLVIQTNGRNLSDETLVKSLLRYTRHVHFVVAVHGTEEAHNRIVNNRKEVGNPYQETLAGIRHLLRYFSPRQIRTEIVLSRFNIADVPETMRFQQEELGIMRIGISYPHLSQFAAKTVAHFTPSGAQIIAMLQNLNDYLAAHPDLEIRLEEMPFCLLARLSGPVRFRTFEGRNRSGTNVNFVGQSVCDFDEIWRKDHAKPAQCTNCVLTRFCLGPWTEAVPVIGPELTPIAEISGAFREFVVREWRLKEAELDAPL